MNKIRIEFIAVSMILFLALGMGLPLFKNKLAYGQLLQDKTLSEQQRLGTYNILYFPDNVSIAYSNGQKASMDQEFILLGNNPNTPSHYQVALSNADYGLPPESVKSTSTLVEGKNFSVDSTNNADIKYSSASVILVPITSPFPPVNIRIQDIDPENDLVLSKPIILGTYVGNSGSFVIPHTAGSGYYLIYVYLHYPSYNMTAVYNTIVHLQ